MGYRFSILGPTALRVGDDFTADWQYPRQRGILTVLLLHPGQAVSFEAITRWVWPSGDKSTSPDTLQRYVQHIKQGLRLLDPVPDLYNRKGILRLDVDRNEVDYWWLRAVVERGADLIDSGEHRQAYELLSRAVRLWTSRPFADLQGQPAEHRRWQAETDLWAPAYDLLLRSLDGLGKSQEMLHRLDDLPFDHRGHCRLAVHHITALYAVGRQRDAMSYLHQARHQLVANDEIDAADELVKQHDRIRQQAEVASPVVVSGNGSGSSGRLSPDMLPQDVDFVGRVDLLDTLGALTTSSGEPARGVVIIDGPPGVGKTALAVHWAHQVRHRFPGGVLFANLSGFSDRTVVDPALVVDEFLIALGTTLNEAEGSQARELTLSRLLAERPTLVILDNVRDHAHVRDLVPRLASSQVVITSRRRLTTLGTTAGARRITVGPMNEAEANELLATQLGPQRVLADDDRARLVVRCGGLPVAISVATAHVATCPSAPIAEFAYQLTLRQLVVDLGDQDGTVNVGGLFAQSYDSLAEPERRLFRLIGLHPGPDIGLDAASACDGRGRQDTSRSLAQLVDAHLLEQPALGRYRAHDLLAEFAVFCVETDEPAYQRHAAGERIVRHYLAAALHAARTAYPTYLFPPGVEELCVGSVEFSDVSRAQSWFYQERQNLMATVAYSVHNGHYQFTYQLADPVSTFCDRLGAHEDSRKLRELSLEATSLMDDHEGQLSALVGSAMTQMTLGELDQARRALDVALRLASEHGVERGEAIALHHLGKLEMVRGDPAAALRLWRQGMAIADRTNDDEGRCWHHCRIGEALRVTEQHDEALIHLSEGRRIAERIGENSAHATALTQLGHLYMEHGDHATAAAHLAHARRLAEAIPDRTATAQACVALAELDIAQRRTGNALRTVHLAIDTCRETRNRPVEAHALAVLGTLCRIRGDIHDAAAAWHHAIDLYQRMGNIARATQLHEYARAIAPDRVGVPATRPSDDHGDRPPSPTSTRRSRSASEKHSIE